MLSRQCGAGTTAHGQVLFILHTLYLIPGTTAHGQVLDEWRRSALGAHAHAARLAGRLPPTMPYSFVSQNSLGNTPREMPRKTLVAFASLPNLTTDELIT